MQTNIYLLTAATVAGLVAGTVGTAALTAKAGVAETRLAEGTHVYTRAQVANATGAQMATAGCAQINTDLGLTGGDVCTLNDVRQIHVFLDDQNNPGMAVLKVLAEIEGTWAVGAPE